MSMHSGDRPRASARQALLDAAVAEFASKGYEAATVAGIARRAGVTTGAVYAHFRGKLELLLEAVGLHTADVFVRRALGIAKRPAHEMSHSLARGLVGTPVVHRDLLLIDAIVRARRDPQVARTYRRVIEAHVEGFEHTARLGIESGRIDPIRSSRACRSARAPRSGRRRTFTRQCARRLRRARACGASGPRPVSHERVRTIVGARRRAAGAA
jgi:AcrR family transcriptional regulator